MTETEATEIYMQWRKRTHCSLRKNFDKWFEGQAWQATGKTHWGKLSVCKKYVMIVMEKSIRLIESNHGNETFTGSISK